MIGSAAHHGRWIGCARSPARANRIRADTLRIGWDKARILRDRRYAGSTPMRLSTSDEQHADASQASPTHDVFSLACLPRTMRTLFRVASRALAARWHTWHTRATARSAQRHAQASKRGHSDDSASTSTRPRRDQNRPSAWELFHGRSTTTRIICRWSNSLANRAPLEPANVTPPRVQASPRMPRAACSNSTATETSPRSNAAAISRNRSAKETLTSAMQSALAKKMSRHMATLPPATRVAL